MKRWVGPVAIFFSVVCLLILCLYDMQKSSSPAKPVRSMKRLAGVLQNKLSPIKRSMEPILSLRIQRQHLCLLRMEAKVTVSLESRR